MMGLVITVSVLSILFINTWSVIFVMVRDAGTWLRKRDLKVIFLFSFVNAFIVLAINKIYEVIHEKRRQQRRTRRFQKLYKRV